MLQVRKVMEHVYEKIINLDNESQTTSSSNNEKAGEQEKEEDIAVLAEEKIELLCQDQVSYSSVLACEQKQWSSCEFLNTELETLYVTFKTKEMFWRLVNRLLMKVQTVTNSWIKEFM